MWSRGILSTGGIPYRDRRSRIPQKQSGSFGSLVLLTASKRRDVWRTSRPKDPNITPYREAILDEVCTEALSSTRPTKENVFFQHGTVVARMFARGTQGRADLVRPLKTKAQGLLEQHGPSVLSQQQLEVLRGVSKAPGRAGRSPSRQRVTLKSVARGTASGTLEFLPVPKRSSPTTRSPAPGKKWQAVSTAEQREEEEHIARIRRRQRSSSQRREGAGCRGCRSSQPAA